ncbi:hypothetical protein AYI69_g6453 [Smittium culicis]|uniref:Prolyl 4-hydroxylase alpha subunit domain-containing protein n=1 Tax=Smittium culicis TaxID=133412 RepID=A0A1R1XZ08_9FUNG|nr:hypothetical protein AYI69_g6453 [Smittium culicis]
MEEYDGEWPVLNFYGDKSAGDTPKAPILSELAPNQIFTIDNFLTEKQCKDFITIIEAEINRDPEGAQIVPSKKPGYAFRNNYRISYNSTGLASELWHQTGLKKIVSENIKIAGKDPIGLHEKIRLYKYSSGQKFGKHYDDHLFNYQGKRTEYTLLIYLNDLEDYISATGTDETAAYPTKTVSNSQEKAKIKGIIKKSRTKPPVSAPASSKKSGCGGETVFYSSKPFYQLSVKPKGGMLLLHKHGADCLIHEGRKVTQGIKYVLRSDVLYE